MYGLHHSRHRAARATRGTQRSRAHGPHQHRCTTEDTHGESDVASHAAAPDHEVVDEEAQRDVCQLICEQLLRESAGEAHEVVGGDGAGHGDGHVEEPFRGVEIWEVEIRDYDNRYGASSDSRSGPRYPADTSGPRHGYAPGP